MEWLWSVDDQDRPRGPVARDTAHVQKVLHRSGVVLLLSIAGDIYLTKRAPSKALFPDRFDTSASFHVSYIESYVEAARRELLEELGLDVPLSELGKFRHDDPPEHQFVTVFKAYYHGEPIQLDPAEASSGRFYSRSEAIEIARNQHCTPWLRHALHFVGYE